MAKYIDLRLGYVYVALKNNNPIGVWGALKHLYEYMKKEYPDFPSYWTIIRDKKKQNEMKFNLGTDSFHIKKVKRHYNNRP